MAGIQNEFSPAIAETTVPFLEKFAVCYIYIFIAITLNETSILVALDFSMRNIYQSCDLGHAVGQSNVNVSQ